MTRKVKGQVKVKANDKTGSPERERLTSVKLAIS
jgi:hypothetical protein